MVNNNDNNNNNNYNNNKKKFPTVDLPSMKTAEGFKRKFILTFQGRLIWCQDTRTVSRTPL